MPLSEHAYTSLSVPGHPAPAMLQSGASGRSVTARQFTRLQLMIVAATTGSAIVGTLVLLMKARPRQQQAVDDTSLPATIIKAEESSPTTAATTENTTTTTEDPRIKLKFPIDFEGPFSGTCPYGFTCSGYSRVCEHPPLQHSCNHPGIDQVQGNKYLLVGNDEDSATATSVPFYLPSNVKKIRWLRSGGSDAPSGVSVRLVGSGEALCTLQGGKDTNVFFEEVCDGLADYASQPVYICVVNTHVGIWSKVLVDDFRMEDQWGDSLDHSGHVELSPTTRLDCPTS